MDAPRVTHRSLAVRLFETLASVRLAVVVMLALAIACIMATVHESRHGAAAAQRDFYQTGWFLLLLALLGLNVLLSMLKRLPWKQHHAGFVLAHVGILVLLLGSAVSLQYGLDSQMALYEGETGDRVTVGGEAIQVTLHKGPRQQVIPDLVSGAVRGQRHALPAGHADLVIEDHAAHVVVTEAVEEGGGGPGLHLVLQNAGGGLREESWLLAGDPERRHVHIGPLALSLDDGAGHGEAEANEVAFVVDAAGRLQHRISTRNGPASRGPVVVGRPIRTPWMDLTVTVDRFLPEAALVRRVVPAPAPAQEGQRVPAVKVRLEGRGEPSVSEWVTWGEERRVAFDGCHASLRYGPAERELPFQVTLLDFDSENYPGSDRAATYESRVRVDDPEHGSSEHLVSMNHPLHHRGYVFFQSSFVQGEPMASILSVARAPGLPLVYAGTALLTLGVAWMFYLKPYLARRQGRRAARAAGVPLAPPLGGSPA